MTNGFSMLMIDKFSEYNAIYVIIDSNKILLTIMGEYNNSEVKLKDCSNFRLFLYMKREKSRPKIEFPKTCKNFASQIFL